MPLNKIIIHWTAGTYKPNDNDRSHYHFLIEGSGAIRLGKFKPEDNINCKDGKYAEHCGGGNTGAIGVSFCGMLGYKNCLNLGDYPLLEKQMESGFKLIAELCKKYNIPATPQTVMTHYEFGKAHPLTSSYGKPDITCIPYEIKLSNDDIGNYIRKKVQWYLQNP